MILQLLACVFLVVLVSIGYWIWKDSSNMLLAVFVSVPFAAGFTAILLCVCLIIKLAVTGSVEPML